MICCLTQKLKILYPSQNLELEAKKKLREANKKQKQAKQNRTKNWDTFMEQLAEARASKSNAKVEGELKPLQTQEIQYMSSKIIQRTYEEGRNRDVVAVVPQDGNGE